MRVFKSLLVIVFGAMLGIVVAILMCPAPDSMGSPTTLRDRALIFLDVVGISIGAIVGGLVAYRLYWYLTRPESHDPMAPDAERDARAKFMPSTDHPSDDAAILPDKRNVRPEDR